MMVVRQRVRSLTQLARSQLIKSESRECVISLKNYCVGLLENKKICSIGVIFTLVSQAK